VLRSRSPRLRFAPRATRCAVALAAALLVAAFAGCGSDTPTGPTGEVAVDTAAVADAIRASGLDADALFPPYEVSLADTASKTAGTATTLAFRRWVTQTTYGNRYEPYELDPMGRPLRVVSLRCKYQKSMLQLVTQLAPQDPTPGDSSDRLIDKYLNQDWMRNVELRRASASSPWVVTAVSPVLLVVDDKRVCADCHADLVEVHLQSGSLDRTLQANSLALDSIIHLTAGQPTTITARSRNDLHIVVLHDAGGSRLLRRSAPNRFTGTLTPGGPGRHHFTVEILSDSTVFDDRVRVSQHGWQFLYDVSP
jgi:hypothetical protein